MTNRILAIQQRLQQKYKTYGDHVISGGLSTRARSLSDQSFDIRYAVPLVPQQTGMSCWAAAAAMIVAWRENYSVDPAEIAQAAGEWAAYSAGLAPESTTIFPIWGLTPEPQQSYTVDGLRHLLETYGPLWVAGAVPGPHVRVVTGMYGDGTPDGTRVLINDPWQIGMIAFAMPNTGSQYEETYSQFMITTEGLADREATTHPRAIYVARSTRPLTVVSQSRSSNEYLATNGTPTANPVSAYSRSRTWSLPAQYDLQRFVPVIKKPSPMTCWAAATAMLVSYKEGKTVPVEEAVRRAGPRYEELLRNGSPLTRADMPDYISALGLVIQPVAKLRVDHIHQMLRRFGALWLTPDYHPAFSQDARIVIGVHGDGTPNGTSLIVIDPSSGDKESVAFDHLPASFERSNLSNPVEQLMVIHWSPDMRLADARSNDGPVWVNRVLSTSSDQVVPEITFGKRANPNVVSQYSLAVIRDVLVTARLDGALITSTARTPYDQARIMFENCEKHGPQSQKDLYAASGDAVIDVYIKGKADSKDKVTIIEEMLAKIYEVGPSRVSRHVADPTLLNVVDIAPSSITDKASFEVAAKADPRISKFLQPPSDPAYHLEIPQP